MILYLKSWWLCYVRAHIIEWWIITNKVEIIAFHCWVYLNLTLIITQVTTPLPWNKIGADLLTLPKSYFRSLKAWYIGLLDYNFRPTYVCWWHIFKGNCCSFPRTLCIISGSDLINCHFLGPRWSWPLGALSILIRVGCSLKTGVQGTLDIHV